MLFLNQGVSENQSFMVGDGKIYVVVVCCLVILLGLLTYLFYLDKKHS